MSVVVHNRFRQVILASLLLLWSGPLLASDGLDIRQWLARPGVRLLVVEFYATWCKPCMEAVPRWTKLHERYREEGLRLVVVNTLDPEGGCRSPGWNPDDMICDLEGFQQTRMKVDGNLPSALLWSWQGNLLVQHGHVDQVERAVERYLASAPRVHVRATEFRGKADPELRAMVVNELNSLKKLAVVADPRELERIRDLRKASHAPTKREEQKCEIGKEVSANSFLSATILGKKKGKRKLSLALYSVESGCQLASHYVGYSEKSPQESVREAVVGLHDDMRRDLVMPTKAGKAVAKKPTQSKTEIEMEAMSREFARGKDSQPTKPLVAEHEKGAGIWGWVLTGTGAALTGGGIYFLLAGQEDRDEVDGQKGDDLKPQEAIDLWDEGNRKSNMGYALTGLGLASVAGGVTWWLLDDPTDTSDPAQSKVGFWHLPTGESGMSYGGRF